MGVLLDILTLPVMGPVKALTWIAGKVAEQADNELYNEDAVRGQLMELEMKLDLDEITEEEYNQIEEQLLARLRLIRERKAAQLKS